MDLIVLIILTIIAFVVIGNLTVVNINLKTQTEHFNASIERLKYEIDLAHIKNCKYNKHERIGDLFILEVYYNSLIYKVKYKVYNERTTKVTEMSEFEIDNYTIEKCS